MSGGNVGSLFVDIGANLSPLKKEISTIGSNFKGITENIKKAFDGVDGSISKTANEVKKATSGIGKIGNDLKNLSGKIFKPTVKVNDLASGSIEKLKGMLATIGGTVGAGALFKHSLGLAADFEQTQTAFESMLGSAEKAKALISDLKTFAIKTPFEFNDLQINTKKLLAFGFGVQQVIPMLTSIGNAASGLGLGADGINRITIALGQMKAKAKVSGDEMLQLTEAGIPAWDILAEATGKTTAEVMKLSEKGLFPANQAIDALLKGMNKRFPDMMIKQSRTLLGLWSSLKDFANLNVFASFGEGIRQGIQPYLVDLVDTLTESEGGLKSFQDTVANVGKEIGSKLADMAKGVVDFFKSIFSDPEFLKLSTGDKIIFVIDKALQNLKVWMDSGGKERIQKIVNSFTTIFVDFLQGSFEILMPAFIQIGTSIGEGILKGLGDTLEKMSYSALVKMIFWNQPELAENIIKEHEQAVGSTNKSPLKSSIGINPPLRQKSFFDMKDMQIPAFATGGIVNSPTLGLIGEAGPEAILPLDKLNVRDKGTINIHVHGVNPEEAANIIVRRLKYLGYA